MAKTIEEYMQIANIKAEDTFTKEQAVKIVNEHTIGLYRGRVKLREDKVFTGHEIADKLHTIEAVFEEEFEKAIEEIDMEELKQRHDAWKEDENGENL